MSSFQFRILHQLFDVRPYIKPPNLIATPQNSDDGIQNSEDVVAVVVAVKPGRM